METKGILEVLSHTLERLRQRYDINGAYLDEHLKYGNLLFDKKNSLIWTYYEEQLLLLVLQENKIVTALLTKKYGWIFKERLIKILKGDLNIDFLINKYQFKLDKEKNCITINDYVKILQLLADTKEFLNDRLN